jgi:ketosteroid isomerase-like protein
MSRQVLYGFAVALLLVVGQMLGAELPPDLARAARDYDQAQMHNDGAALNRLLTDDYMLVNSRGVVETKAQFIADSTAPGFRLDPFVVREPIIKVWRDGAVLGGLVMLSGTDGGKKFSVLLRFADIWAKRNSRWQVVYTGVTRAADIMK